MYNHYTFILNSQVTNCKFVKEYRKHVLLQEYVDEKGYMMNTI